MTRLRLRAECDGSGPPQPEEDALLESRVMMDCIALMTAVAETVDAVDL